MKVFLLVGKWFLFSLEVIACICVTLNRDFNFELGKINSNKWFRVFKCAYYSMFCLKIIPKPMCCVNGFCKFYSETNVLCKWFFQVLFWNHFVEEMVSECWFALELFLTISLFGIESKLVSKLRKCVILLWIWNGLHVIRGISIIVDNLCSWYLSKHNIVWKVTGSYACIMFGLVHDI